MGPPAPLAASEEPEDTELQDWKPGVIDISIESSRMQIVTEQTSARCSSGSLGREKWERQLLTSIPVVGLVMIGGGRK